jgi:hypothetical protein
MVDVKLESITPELAAEWLEKNLRNRNLRDSAVAQYARDMVNGQWLLTGEAIKFAEDGTLLDGQHRLAAIEKSGLTVDMFVVRGLENESQKVMDTNIRRGVGDMLKLAGYANHMALASAARLAMTYQTNVPNTRRKSIAKMGPTHLEVSDFIEKNPDLVDAVQDSMKYRLKIDINPSVLAVTYWELMKLDAEMAENFFESIANNTTNGIGDPRNALIQRLSSARRASEQIPQNAYLSMMFRVWNAWVKGDEMYRVQVSNNRDGGLIAIPDPIQPS